jgi:predicted permease
VVGPGYFRTLGAALFSGREFSQSDGVSAIPVAIVNQRFAATYFPRENPVGKHLRLTGGTTPGPWLTIVGVSPDILQDGVTRRAVQPLLYLPYRQRPSANMEIVARTRVPADSLAGAFRSGMQSLDARVPVFGPLSLDERLRAHYWTSGLYSALFLIFAAIALLIAGVGLFAVIARAVNRRTQEIGIRMAIGATGADIRRLVLRQGMVPTAIGLAIGIAASFAVNRVLQSALVEVSPTDPVTLLAASATLVLAAALGCLVPARRAMRVDPLVALRHD